MGLQHLYLDTQYRYEVRGSDTVRSDVVEIRTIRGIEARRLLTGETLSNCCSRMDWGASLASAQIRETREALREVNENNINKNIWTPEIF